MGHTICFASSNQGKLQEIQSFFSGLPINFISQSQYVTGLIEETGQTFVENAILKARHASQYAKIPSLSDDSGLCIDCLNSAPGVNSSSFAGNNSTIEQNQNKILEALKRFRKKPVTARMVTVFCFFHEVNDLRPKIITSILEGLITDEPRGELRGYDAIFYIPSLGKTLGELSIQEKNEMSARGLAMRALKKYLTSNISA